MPRRLSPNSAVAWLGPPLGQQGIAGQAFLVSEQVALTCAHVVRDHLGLGATTPAERPSAKVKLSFGGLRREVGACVAECGWFPDRTGADVEDVAVLLLDEPLDEIPHPGLAPVDPPDRAACYAYGSLAGYTGIGQQAWALLGGTPNDRGWHQLNADTTRGGYFVKRGFSGAPVLDPLAVTVWGMVVEVDRGAEDEQRLVAFAVPAGMLRDAHLAVKLCARRANRRTPEVTVRLDGPLDPLARETALSLGAGRTVQASGVGGPPPGGTDAESLLDAVRTLAEAGVDPTTRNLASAGLRGLAAGETAAAERFFADRLARASPVVVGATVSGEPIAGRLAGWRGHLSSILGAASDIFSGASTSDLRSQNPPSSPGPRQDRSDAAAAEEARRLGAVLALKDVRAALEAYEQAARLEPDDAWTWIEVCRLARQSGQLDRAAAAAAKAREAASAAGDARDVMAADTELGDARVAQGNLADAERAYRAAISVAERLAAADPGNAGWQRDLSVSWNKLGGLRLEQGDLAGALEAFGRDLEIAERLAALDGGNAGWQLDVAISNSMMGRLRAVSGERAEAVEHFRKGLGIARALAAAGRLAPRDAGIVGRLERGLAEVGGEAGQP